MRILLLDDQRDVRDGVAKRLRKEGHTVFAAATIAEANDALGAENFDVLVLDRALPDGDVAAHLEAWQRRGVTARILLLTAASTVHERVEGLAAGADDYLTKPFALAELVARVQSLGRRPSMAPLREVVVGDLHIALSDRQVSRSGVLLPLRPKEFMVLEVLARRTPRPVSREALRELVWDDDLPEQSNVDEVTIAALRRKLGAPELIRTVRGVGWALVAP